MGRKNYLKGSNETDRKIVDYSTNNFKFGLIKDYPATEIPDQALAEAYNVIVHLTEVQGRPGSRQYGSVELPPISGKTGLIARKSGTTITCTTSIFTQADVGNYFVWPGSDTEHDEIVRYNSGVSIEVADSGTKVSTVGCYMRGKMNMWKFHTVLKQWLFLLGTDFWILDVDGNTWTKINVISSEKPYNTVSQADEFDNWSWIVFNSSGHFHVSQYSADFLAWKRNIEIPNVAIDEQPPTALSKYQYGYIYSAARLTEQGNLIDRLLPSRIEVETGTNSWDETLQDYNDVWTPKSIDVNSGVTITNLTVPTVENSDPPESCWHMTHFPIYRTLDKFSLYQQGTEVVALNDPQRFVWVKDLRIGAALFGRRFNGHALLTYGEFEQADVGSTIQWEDGAVDTILRYVSPTDVEISWLDYYDDESIVMAAAIGGGRVIRASQSGHTVSRSGFGGSFVAGDVGKSILWCNGYRSIITAFVNSSTVTVLDSNTQVTQGITTDMTHRNFYDDTSDDILRTRMRNLICSNRFMEPMPNVNDGIVVPGFMITARRDEKELYYCAWADNYEYLASFYYKGYQYSTAIKQPIKKLLKGPKVFAALCSDFKTWGGPTNTSEVTTLSEVNVVMPILSGIDIIDNAIGCFDFGSIQEVDNGQYIFLTDEPSGVGLRRFNGVSYGVNLMEIPKIGKTTITKEICALQKATASVYDATMGYIVWGRV